ncbi:unnamed protein product [Merluccius merluccius]
MEEQDRSRSPSRRTSRVEQVVGRWLRRSRDLGSRSHSLSRDRVSVDGKTGEQVSDQRSYSFRFTVQIQRSSELHSHGLSLTSQAPILVQEVTAGGPADGRLVPGDQLVKINNVAVEDLTPEQAAEIIRECQDTVTMTVLRTMVGPKSSFITPEKRAKLRSNPVKVHFAEEVEVNGNSQGNTLLFLPNVLKVYLENGQTKAFKFEPSTTVKDIVMTLKEKLSLSRIEHFCLVLEQQYSVTKLLLLHEEERIQQVVQKKESHDYRCLFRVCYMPKDPRDLLLEDPTAFEYLYLQGVNDVLQERFAVEMRCNTALRLAALHIQERLASCGQSPKTNLKTITKTWGIENFVSSTLLRNMREKDLRKAIGYHMKKSQSQQDPKQKGLSFNQARINYLEELSELKSFGGKSFSATMMLQDRESMVSLLVGARYGVSQVVNHKLSIMTTLTEFTNITRIELLPESDRISLVKIYLQDIKPITLLLESVAAKDMSCLIAGYCRVFVNPDIHVFPWPEKPKKHRVSAEEGYVSRRASDSDTSSDMDMDQLIQNQKVDELGQQNINEETKGAEMDTGPIQIEITKAESGEGEGTVRVGEEGAEGKEAAGGDDFWGGEEAFSEASDSCHTDSRFLTSPSSDSLDALEEDDLISCSSSVRHHPDPHSRGPPSSPRSSQKLHPYKRAHPHPHLLAPPPAHSHPIINLTPELPTHTGVGCTGEDAAVAGECRRSGDGADPNLSTSNPTHSHHTEQHLINPCSQDNLMGFAELSRHADYLPSPPEASEEEDEDEEELERRRGRLMELNESLKQASEVEGDTGGEVGVEQTLPLSPAPNSTSSCADYVFNFDQSDARCYYKLCSSVTPDSALSPPHPMPQPDGEQEAKKPAGEGELAEAAPILQPPPGFGDSSSEEEFFDAWDSFASPEDPSSGDTARVFEEEMEDGQTDNDMGRGQEGGGVETLIQLGRRSRKRRSFMETNFTSRVTFPEPGVVSNQTLSSTRIQRALLPQNSGTQHLNVDPEASDQSQNICPTVASLTHSEGEPALLESKPIPSKSRPRRPGSPKDSGSLDSDRDPCAASRRQKQEMEMEPDAMESKPVTDLVKLASPSITVVRCRVEPDGKENSQTKDQSTSNSFTQMTSSDYEDTINSITAKLGVATSAVSPLLNACEPINQETTSDIALCTDQDKDTFRSDSTMPDPASGSKVSLGMASEATTKHSFVTPCVGLAKANMTTVNNLSKEPPSPTHFLFHTCSPSIMGRLSASTLRDKIQRLPLYLSRSQETLNQTGLDNVSKSPCNVVLNINKDKTAVPMKIVDVDNVTQAMYLGTSPRKESIDSDESDVTLTGSEMETEPPISIAGTSDTRADMPGPIKEAPESTMKTTSPISNIPDFIMNSQSPAVPPLIVVTTQTHNGPGLSFYSPTEKVRTSSDRPLMGLCSPAAETTSSIKTLSSGCEMFTMCPDQSQTNVSVSNPTMKPDYSCSSVLASACESVVEGVQMPLEACGCTTVYTNCFSSGDNFDDELTVYEFSCRSQSSRAGSTSEVGLPLITTAPVPSFLSKSPPSFSASTLSPSFPRSIIFSSATSELSPLLSPLSDSSDSVSSQTHKETISSIRQHCYPAAPAGFQPLRSDVDQLIAVLEGGGGVDRSVGGHGGRHARETCPAHFTENKCVLHMEAGRLMAGCQKVAGLGQDPEEMLVSLADSFRHLVELAGACLWFSGCDRCDRRNGEAVAGLADVARSFRDFCLAAERACSKRSCQDLSAKLLAKQCTALTASVFCLTQLFRTLTAL